MPFLESVFSKLGFGDEITPYPFRYVVLGGRAAVIEGIREILSLSDEEIVFSVGKSLLKIRGSGLAVKKYGGREVTVTGVVTGVYSE